MGGREARGAALHAEIARLYKQLCALPQPPESGQTSSPAYRALMARIAALSAAYTQLINDT